MRIKVSEEFTDSPGGRYIGKGEFSGEEFRKTFLESAIRDTQEKVTVDLDGTFGYPISFLEEAFGGLARIFGVEIVLERLTFISQEDPLLIERIVGYIKGRK
jgi:hypothetical protein